MSALTVRLMDITNIYLKRISNLNSLKAKTLTILFDSNNVINSLKSFSK